MGVPAIGSQPVTVRVAALIGAAQAVGLASYALALVSFEATSSTAGMQGSSLAPGVLVTVYLVFAGVVAAVGYWLATGHAAARTPFLLIQGFGLVIAQPLFVGDGTMSIAIAIVLAVAVAIGCVLSSSARSALR